MLRKPVIEGLVSLCEESLSRLPGDAHAKKLRELCETADQYKECVSEQGKPIFHIDFQGKKDSKAGQKILVFALIHGDESESGTLARTWSERLLDLDSRNTWRVIPILNPDGWTKGTRQNSNGVDVNRNFPTQDWDKAALERWMKKEKKDPRRFPGEKPASEAETRCAMKHINEFNPDFIVSLHTPYGVLDFDGPQVVFPLFPKLPWTMLGNFPGSLGRYMWKDNQVPVLTIELRSLEDFEKVDQMESLQDIAGTVAIKSAEKITGKSKDGERRLPDASEID